MKNLDKKLKNLEDKIVENRLQKKQRRERIDKRDFSAIKNLLIDLSLRILLKNSLNKGLLTII